MPFRFTQKTNEPPLSEYFSSSPSGSKYYLDFWSGKINMKWLWQPLLGIELKISTVHGPKAKPVNSSSNTTWRENHFLSFLNQRFISWKNSYITSCASDFRFSNRKHSNGSMSRRLLYFYCITTWEVMQSQEQSKSTTINQNMHPLYLRFLLLLLKVRS